MPDDQAATVTLPVPEPDGTSPKTPPPPPVRGSLRLDPSVSSPQITAGTDFSIFVVAQNPFDVPVTVYQVQSHIPVELVDMIGYLRNKFSKRAAEPLTPSRGWWRQLCSRIANRIAHRFADKFDFWGYRTGVAVAVSTNYSPERTQPTPLLHVESSEIRDGARVAGIQFILPERMAAEEVAHIVQNLQQQSQGIDPVVLQPGDSVVHQFVLCTRGWLFFTPLTHAFQIQVNFATEGIRHNQTVSFQVNIRATILAMALGAIGGAIVGAWLKSLTTPEPASAHPIWRAMTVAVLASFAVVVAFARKSNAQSLVSVEDFWGGALIGFSVGFFGFDQFSSLFSAHPPAPSAPR